MTSFQSQEPRRALPKTGSSVEAVMEELRALTKADTDRAHGAFALRWPTQTSGSERVGLEAYSALHYANALFSRMLPSMSRMESELKDFVASIMRAPPEARVTLTVGGTESNFLAVRAARNRARAQGRKIARPRIVMAQTGHPSFDKAADYMEMDITRVPATSDDRADPEAIRKAVDDSTILIVGSAPSYTHGVVDPIRELAAIAKENGTWMHVDACVGGFLHPFLRQLGHDLPDFDLSIDGVDSISADLHKFGHAPHGISTLTVREEKSLLYHGYEMADWPFGQYRTSGLVGSKSGGIVAGAWAVMVHLGLEGYLDIARRIADNAERLAQGANAIEGLSTLRKPEVGIVTVAGSDRVPIPALADAMRRRGWPTWWFPRPQALHLLSDPVESEVVDLYLADLRSAAEEVAEAVEAGMVVTTSGNPRYSDGG